MYSVKKRVNGTRISRDRINERVRFILVLLIKIVPIKRISIK